MLFPELKIHFGKKTAIKKKRAERISARGYCDIVFKKEGSRDLCCGEIKDLSLTGLRLVSESALPKGTLLEFKMHYPTAYGPDDLPLQAKIQVVRCYRLKGQHRFRIGCIFVDLESQMAARSNFEFFLQWLRGQHGTKEKS